VHVSGAHSWQIHSQGRKHLKKAAVKTLQDPTLQVDKKGVKVTMNLPEPCNTSIGVALHGSIVVENINTTDSVVLKECAPIQPQPALVFKDMLGDCNGERQLFIEPGSQYTIQVSCVSENPGRIGCWFVLQFETSGGERFQIGRIVEVRVVDAETPAELGASSEYKEKADTKRAPKQAHSKIVRGRPPNQNQRPKMKKLPGVEIPKNVQKAFEGRNTTESNQLTALLKQPLGPNNYQTKYRTLLYLEQCQEEIDIQSFDMRAVKLQRSGQSLVLHVPGLAESRPSVLPGDQLYVSSDRNPREYGGQVHQVQNESVLLKFPGKFHSNHHDSTLYNVRFSLRAMQLKLQLGAVNNVQQTAPPWVLFPREPPNSLLQRDSSNRRATNGLNAEQLEAVARAMEAKSVPYILFGPPGTGKSRTLVHYVVQVLASDPQARVLVSAPSNSATDLLVERLVDRNVPRNQMLRVNAYQRDERSVSTKVKDCCDMLREGEGFRLPTLDEMLRARVVAATCLTAGKLGALKAVQAGVFTHVVIDEAGHATEPETLCALTHLAHKAQKFKKKAILTSASNSTPEKVLEGVLLAGDPKQLGPIIRSALARKHGLAMSMLSRLMNDTSSMIGYSKDGALEHSAVGHRMPHACQPDRFPDTNGYNPRCVTMLVKNYRSHPSIIELPSQMFYNNALQPCADVNTVRAFTNWEGLPSEGQDFPLIFHGVIGDDMREGNSPSWFNPTEAMAVYQYIQQLRQRRPPVRLDNIGVITPYHKQKLKIRRLLESKSCPDVKVGSIEEFQGQERQVIIVSCVRSNKDIIAADLAHNLGFLSNPRRFNVAVTRAKALLIIIGNPLVLVRDKHWGRLLRFIVRQGGYTGCVLPQWLIDQSKQSEDYLRNINMDDARDDDLIQAMQHISREAQNDVAVFDSEHPT